MKSEDLLMKSSRISLIKENGVAVKLSFRTNPEGICTAIPNS